MNRLSDVLEQCDDTVYFYCPGCLMHHGVRVSGDQQPIWMWDQNAERPTFTPSILVRGIQMLSEEEREMLHKGIDFPRRPLVCHSFVTDGQIQFLTDCTHELAGQTVQLPNLDDEDKESMT